MGKGARCATGLRAVRRFLKFAHLGGVALALGALACEIVLAIQIASASGVVRRALLDAGAHAASWLLVPGLLVAVVSGLLAIAVHRPFMDEPWVWLKALIGMVMAGVVLLSTQPAINEAARMVDEVGLGKALEGLTRGVWQNLVLGALAMALGVWRPRIALHRRT